MLVRSMYKVERGWTTALVIALFTVVTLGVQT